MSPPTRSNISHGFDGAFPKALINNELFQNRNLIGGLMSPPYGLSRFQRDKLKVEPFSPGTIRAAAICRVVFYLR